MALCESSLSRTGGEELTSMPERGNLCEKKACHNSHSSSIRKHNEKKVERKGDQERYDLSSAVWM